MTTNPIGDRAKMYVGGAWVGATNDRAMAVSNPATGEVLAHVPDASREDVWRAIDQAAAAFPKWAHASTNFSQQYRVVAHGPCSAPASEMGSLSGRWCGRAPGLGPRLVHASSSCGMERTIRRGSGGRV